MQVSTCITPVVKVVRRISQILHLDPLRNLTVIQTVRRVSQVHGRIVNPAQKTITKTQLALMNVRHVKEIILFLAATKRHAYVLQGMDYQAGSVKNVQEENTKTG